MLTFLTTRRPLSDPRRVIVPLEARYDSNLADLVHLDLIQNRCTFEDMLNVRRTLKKSIIRDKLQVAGSILILMEIVTFSILFSNIEVETSFYILVFAGAILLIFNLSFVFCYGHPMVSRQWLMDNLNKDMNPKGIVLVYKNRLWFEMWRTECYGINELHKIIRNDMRTFADSQILNDMRSGILQVMSYYSTPTIQEHGGASAYLDRSYSVYTDPHILEFDNGGFGSNQEQLLPRDGEIL